MFCRRSLLLSLAAAPTWVGAAVLRVPLAVGEHGGEQWRPLFELLGRSAGLNFVLNPLPWPRAQAFAAQGEGLIFGLARTPERVRRFAFSLPVLEVMSWGLVRRGEAERFRAGFAERTLCMARSSAYPTTFAAQGIAVGAWVESEQGDPAAGRMLLAGRCDAAVLTLRGRDASEATQHLHSLGVDLADVELLPRPITQTALHFATRPQGPWMPHLQRLNAALQRERSAIDRLMRETD